MKKHRLVPASALAVTAALPLSGCSRTPSTNTSTDAGGSSSAPTASATDMSATGGVNLRVWLVGTDTPQPARDYLKTTFESQNPGNTLTIEEQSWTGLVDKYTTALSGSDSPDVVEIGNTQAPTFTATGFFTDLTDKYQELGGDDLLPGFTQIGSYDGKFFAPPYYSGARVITYTTQMFSGTVPTTWDEFLADAKSASSTGVSGLYLRGKDWHDGIEFVWANGGEIATQNSDGSWTAGLASDASVKGLQEWQDLFTQQVSQAPTDQTESDLQVPFCAGQAVFLPAPSWVAGSISAAEDATTPGCGATLGNPDDLHQFAAPGLTAGTFTPVLAGGSNLAIPTKSANQDLAYKALQIMLSDDYQTILAQAGMVPAKVSQAKFMPDNESSKAAANAASAAKLTPASEKWSDVEAQLIMEDGFSKIAQGQDVATVAADMDSKIEAILNG
jgi:N,N'-diacetylchitobiose transport system substrate-binding protein